MKTLKNNVLIFSAKSMPVAEQVKESLQEFRIKYEFTNNQQRALEFIAEQSPCLVFIDVDLADAKAQDFLKKIKKQKEEDAFEVLFMLDDNKDFELQWNLFKSGVDEIGYRSTNPSLTALRVRNILKRYEHPLREVPTEGVVIDRERYLVFIEGREVTLPRKEFELLSLLASSPEKVFTRSEIFRQLWGSRLVVGDRTIDVHIRKIRERIGEDLIKTVKGVGYKFCGI